MKQQGKLPVRVKEGWCYIDGEVCIHLDHYTNCKNCERKLEYDKIKPKPKDDQ